MPGSPGGPIAEGLLVQAMWWYAGTMLYPSQALKRIGLVPRTTQGDLPQPVRRRGLGPHFSRIHREPVLLDAPTEHDHLVEEFDRIGEVYDAFVRPFSQPIFDEAVVEMKPFLPADARVLDAGCGAGLHLRRMARLVPHGEVVGIDLAAGMVCEAHRAALAHGLDNVACVQADVGDLPSFFDGQLDLVYSSLAHHHYPDPPAATRAVLRVLRPGGIYAVVDPGPAWYNRMSAPIARWADPGWIGFHTPEEFQRLFLEAGFARAGWIDLLPGFGLAVGQKREA